MDILPNQEFYLLAAVRDAHGDATGLTGKAKTAAAEDARAFLAHVGIDWRRVHPRRVPERAHAYRLIDAATVAVNLSPMGDILLTAERQARPLTVLEPAQQREAWQRAENCAGFGLELALCRNLEVFPNSDKLRRKTAQGSGLNLPFR